MHSPGLLRDEPRFSPFHKSLPILVLSEFTCIATGTGTCNDNGSGSSSQQPVVMNGRQWFWQQVVLIGSGSGKQ
jgi:hypothetical protein